MGEVLPIYSSIYIPASKEDAFVYPAGSVPKKDSSMERQGIWAKDPDRKKYAKLVASQKDPVKVWFFKRDKHGNIPEDVPDSVFENEKLKGEVGISQGGNPRKPKPHELIFYPPKAKIPQELGESWGYWIVPSMKQDVSKDLAPGTEGFVKVSGKTVREQCACGHEVCFSKQLTFSFCEH